MKDTEALKKEATRYAEKVERFIATWKDIYENGGSDPFCEDGLSCNALRGKIIRVKNHLMALYLAGITETMPPQLVLETPPELDSRYMAKTDEIRAKAKDVLRAYQENDDYRYLVTNRSYVPREEAKNASLTNIIRYVSELRMAVENDNLLTMRRHVRDKAIYEKAFAQCRASIEGACKEKRAKDMPKGQLNLFDLAVA